MGADGRFRTAGDRLGQAPCCPQHLFLLGWPLPEMGWEFSDCSPWISPETAPSMPVAARACHLCTTSSPSSFLCSESGDSLPAVVWQVGSFQGGIFKFRMPITPKRKKTVTRAGAWQVCPLLKSQGGGAGEVTQQ